MSDQIEEIEDELPDELPEVEIEAEEKPPEVDPEAEAEARKYGWKPKSEFDRDPAGWVDANRFLELPATQVKVSRDTRRELEKQLKERDEKLARIEGTVKTAVDRVRDQERQRYDAEITRLAQAKREAVEVGDVDRYDAITQREKQITPPAESDEPERLVNNAPAPEVAEYVANAKWAQDPTAYALAVKLIDSDQMAKFLPPMKQVKWAEERLKQYYPEHFDAPAPSAPAVSRVDGGGLGGFTKRDRGAESLPPDVMKVAKGFVAEGIFKSVDEYAKDYFAQGGTK